jgi:hypothetical protein
MKTDEWTKDEGGMFVVLLRFFMPIAAQTIFGWEVIYQKELQPWITKWLGMEYRWKVIYQNEAE